MVTFTEKQLLDIAFEYGFYNGEVRDENFVEVDIIHRGDWIADHKYESQFIVFNYNGVNYGFEITRSGSYWSDYEHYVWDNAYKVKQVEKVVKEWVRV